MDQEGKYCEPIDQESYNNIKQFVKNTKQAAKNNGNDLKKFKIHCHSNYLKAGVFSLIISLLF